MRILAITFGTEGDWRPLTALCGGLQSAGHDVLLLAPAPAADLAARLGVRFEALAGDMARELEAAMPMLTRRGGNAAALAHVFSGLAVRNIGEWTRAMMRHGDEVDAILCAGLAIYVGLSCAEALDKPVIGAGLQPVMPTGAFASPFLPPLRLPAWANRVSHRLVLAMLWKAFRGSINRARREITGQAPRRDAWTGYPCLFGISPTLVAPPADWPPHYLITGEWRTPDDPDWQPDAALRAFLTAGEPPVYVGFGSMLGFDPAALTRVVVDALGGRRALLFMGAAGLGAGALPASVLRIGPLPHGWLFPRVRLVVHHGGAGTTHAAAHAGKPSVVVPFAGDQPFWAERARRLGIAPAPIRQRALDAAVLAQRIDEALGASFAERAAAIGRAMAHEHGVARGVAAFAQLAARPGRADGAG